MAFKLAAPAPTWREIYERIKSDPDYPSDRRAYDMSRIKKALDWSAAPTWDRSQSPVKQASPFLDQRFSRQSISDVFDNIVAAELRRSDKTIDNTRSACNWVADHYGLAKGIAFTPLSAECQRLLSLTNSKWDRAALVRFMRYLSAIDVSPWAITPMTGNGFATALKDEFRIVDPGPKYIDIARIWNRLAKADPEWPQVQLPRPALKRRMEITWAQFPSLEAAVDEYLARGQRNHMSRFNSEEEVLSEPIDPELEAELMKPLSAAAIAGNKAALKSVVEALIQNKVTPDSLSDLRALCEPGLFKLALRTIKQRHGNKVTRTVFGSARALFRAARHPGVLTKEEIKIIKPVYLSYEHQLLLFLETHEDRDQKTLDQLDDPSVMNAFLALPTRTKIAVLQKPNRHTLACAYAIQRALILELWLCAPYRIGMFRQISLDQILNIELKRVRRMLLRAPKVQSRNKRTPEHFLNEAVMDLLRLYLDDYRDLIAKQNSSIGSTHLFPGRAGKAKAQNSLHHQITHYVRNNTSLKDWHPHVMRKIVPKLTLDGDPGALEVARRTGGWKTNRMLHDVYGQAVHRESQVRYLDLLEDRRLTSIRAAVPQLRRRRLS